jgi:hypothetical protein
VTKRYSETCKGCPTFRPIFCYRSRRPAQHDEALALAAASTRISHMEETLGAALLVRGRQGVTPTQAGRT